ncbi:NAD-dependent epimerase/dehydratase family protein [uncultured Williamsia sp.]|uniref:NAD-dependent epimerase/dehydratase family protein n=1 Tax=uncultured Williamsia sp. TaxID=259311 RepID=UPI00260D04EF|nr:NAD-dependent epimerase/dehydratase family protein [uncultured Williamsia sp.]
MKVLVTGASGWIGSAVTRELVATGHEVLGLARSDASMQAVQGNGATPLRGDLDDLSSLRTGAESADAVVHLGMKHDWAHVERAFATERAAVDCFGDVLAGSGRRLIIAGGLAALAEGRPATEDDRSPFHGADSPRGGAENFVLDLVDRDVAGIVVRFAPTVHGVGDHGFIATITAAARRHGVSGYAGAGDNRWAAVHRDDAARLVGLAVTGGEAGAILHAVGEEGIRTRDVAEAIGAAEGVPAQSLSADVVADQIGPFVGGFFAHGDMAATSDRTRSALGWEPRGRGLLADIAAGAYA